MNQKDTNSPYFYPEKEERLNILSHWYGFLCSVICFPFLIVKSVSTGDPIYIFSLTIFGITLMLMIITSTMYHRSINPKERERYRILDMFARRLQVQERMTQEVADMLNETLNPKGVAVILEAQHMCMQMRGVEKKNSYMSTSAMHGIFRDDDKTRKEFLDIIKLEKKF